MLARYQCITLIRTSNMKAFSINVEGGENCYDLSRLEEALDNLLTQRVENLEGSWGSFVSERDLWPLFIYILLLNEN